jgi:hypothetical protein
MVAVDDGVKRKATRVWWYREEVEIQQRLDG